jgi:hypothetical protein
MILGFIAAVVSALVIFHQLRPLHLPEHEKLSPNFASRAKIMDAPLPDIAKEVILKSSVDTTSSEPQRVRTIPARVEGDDQRLRAFDEL